MSDLMSKEIRMKSRPVGLPNPQNFDVVSTTVRKPGEDEVVVRNLWMSVDPVMRIQMQGDGYEPFQIGGVLQGFAVGQVVDSKSDSLKVGDYVESHLGWREYAVDKAALFNKIDISVAAPEAYLGVLGLPGLSAYFGLLYAGELKDGDKVFVSAASGAVGQIVCQLAKARGCYVIGSAGSDEKCRWLEKEIGVDKTINYKTCGNLGEAVAKAFPEGIDVYFSNVAGQHLEVAITNMKRFGRIALCGMVDTYNNSTPAPGPSNLLEAISKTVRLQGFMVFDYLPHFPTFYAEVGAMVKNGKIKWQETIVNGIESAPDAFIGLFSGKNNGKMLVKLV